jgi:rSAM/selenodomain-associated transferase 1
MRQTLILMLKEPRVGRVKTRLGRDIGMVDSAWWFRHQSARLVRRLRDPRWQIVLAVSPDVRGMTSRCWPGDLARIPQGRGDLGQRMKRVLRHIRVGRVCLVGADIPDLSSTHVERAFRALGSNEVVFGPAVDGGFWLVGVRHGRAVPQGLFQSVRWSGPNALSDSIASVAGLRVAVVDQLKDVDEVADLSGHAPSP